MLMPFKAIPLKTKTDGKCLARLLFIAIYLIEKEALQDQQPITLE